MLNREIERDRYFKYLLYVKCFIYFYFIILEFEVDVVIIF